MHQLQVSFFLEDATLPRYTLPTPPQHLAQPQNLLHRLPRELRDATYEYVFADESIYFNHRGLNISAFIGTEKHNTPQFGLPAWLLTCHLMCEEGMETFLRLCTFSPRYRHHDRIGPLNTLLLHANSIRKVMKYNEQAPHWTNIDRNDPSFHYAPFLMFLQYIKPFLIPAPSLAINVVNNRSGYYVIHELDMCGNWSKRFYGRFRKVQLSVFERGVSDDERRARKSAVEDCVKKLVDNGTCDFGLVWEDEKKFDMEPGVCGRCGFAHGWKLRNTNVTLQRLRAWR